MPHPEDRKPETRDRILRSARRLFNQRGFVAVTIEEIMCDAGLTRGGFYKHFDTKEELFAQAIGQFGRDAPEAWQTAYVDPSARGCTLAHMIVEAYLSKEHLEDRDGSCPLIGLSTDTARENSTVKAAYRQVLDMMAGAFEANLAAGEASARERALALVALCVGGMVLARAVDRQDLADDIRNAARGLVLETSGWSNSADAASVAGHLEKANGP